MKLVIILTLSSLSAFAECSTTPSRFDHWPANPIYSGTPVSSYVNAYKSSGGDWRLFAQSGPYARGGDYMNWSVATWDRMRWTNTRADSNGVVMQSYDGNKTFVYQPNTITQQALWLYADALHGRPLSPLFWTNVDAVAAMQLSDGSIPYSFDINVGVQPLTNGWVSGLEQGQAASMFVRAYKLSSQPRYLRAAESAIHFMLRPEPEGCLSSLADLDPSLARYRMIQEYPYHPDSFTLNGSLFALLGLYDWLEYEPGLQCMFEELVSTVGRLLPYYDAPGASTYDLQHLAPHGMANIQVPYQLYNTMLVWTVDSIAPSPEFNRTWRTWAEYIGQGL